MPQQAYKATDFVGLTPAIDARQSDKFFALGGKNYVFDSKGPKSAFGNRFLTPYPIGRPSQWQSCRLKLRGGDRVFTFVGDSIIEWDESTGSWKFIYVHGDITSTPYRWTFGYLNGYMYFCHPVTGILVYEITSQICQPLIGPGVPTEPIAISINNGRLTVIDDTWFTWSAPGSGLDFVPRLGGAGQQRINDRVAGDPIMITAYSRGVLVWTTGGVMRVEFTGDAAVYRFRAINTEYRLVNSFCSFQMDDDTVVILDERGLFQSKGEAPSALTPIFNEFLIDWLQRYDLKIGQNVRLEWDDLQRRLYVSVSLSESSPLYEKAFVLYPPLDKWGVFESPHYGIGPVLIQDSTRGDDYFGFCDDGGRVRYWDEVGSREVLPTNLLLNSVYPLTQKPAAADLIDEATVLSSSFSLNTHETWNFEGWAGFRALGSNSNAPASVTGLDAVIQLGLLRLEGATHDRLGEVSQIFIASNISREGVIVDGEDYNLIPDGVSDEDYNLGVGGEDFGLDPLNYVNHGLRIIGTNDGKSAFMSVVPELVLFNQAGRYYSCSCVGLWSILELTAAQVGEMFHLRVFELNFADAGRLT